MRGISQFITNHVYHHRKGARRTAVVNMYNRFYQSFTYAKRYFIDDYIAPPIDFTKNQTTVLRIQYDSIFIHYYDLVLIEYGNIYTRFAIEITNSKLMTIRIYTYEDVFPYKRTILDV